MNVNFHNFGEQFKMKIFPSFFKKKSEQTKNIVKPTQPDQKQEKITKVSSDLLSSSASSQKKITNATVVPAEEKKSEGIIGRIHRYVRDFFYEKCKGKAPSRPEEINQAMKTIGGEQLSLETSEGAELRGMYFSAESLVKKLQDSGMKRVAITTKNDDNESEEISAMVLDPKNPKTPELMAALEQMGLFKLTHKDKKTRKTTTLVDGVWEKMTVDGKIYIFTKENIGKLRNVKTLFDKSGDKFNEKYITVSEPFNKPFVREQKKTIVLNGGLYSHYESVRTASEVAKLVALGFDVVVSEDKHPRIKDTESHSKVMASRDAIYQELQRRGIANEDIIWKGTCFSSVPAVEAAAKYSGSHVWIDQGYFESSELVAAQVPGATGFMSPVIRPVVNKVAKSVDFDYNMDAHLPKVKGQIIMIRNANDTVISEEQHTKIKNALPARANSAEFFITDKNVTHAGAWFDDATCNQQIVDHLIAQGMSCGDILA